MLQKDPDDSPHARIRPRRLAFSSRVGAAERLYARSIGDEKAAPIRLKGEKLTPGGTLFILTNRSGPSSVEDASNGTSKLPGTLVVPAQDPTQMRSHRLTSTALAARMALVALVLTGVSCSRLTVRREMHEANGLYKAQKYEDAITHYKKVVQLDPSYREAWLNMGYAYRALFHPGSTHPKDLGYATEGIAAFRKYLDLDPESEQARQYFLEFCTSAEKHDDAIQFFEAELQKKPDSPQMMKSLAGLYAKKGEAEKALEVWRKWTALEPRNAEAWYTIGVVSWERSYKNQTISNEERRQVIQDGVDALGKALDIRPDYFDALSYMNLIYREKAKLEMTEGNSAAAGQDFETADSYLKKALAVRNAQVKSQAKAG